MMFRRLTLILLAGVLLVGCNNEKTRNLIDLRTDQTTQGLQEIPHQTPPKSYNPLTVTDKVWAGSSSLRMRRGLPLPGKYEGPHGVTIIASDSMQLSDIANTISAQTGIPVRIAPGTAGGSSSGSSGGSSSSASTGGMPLAYEGPLSGLLDHVSGYFGINWKYDGAAINFSKFETRVFAIETMPGTLSVKDGMKDIQTSSSSSSSSGGVSTTGNAASTNNLEQSSEMNVEIKVWDELKETLTSMLGGVGSVVIAPSSGTATVTTTPELMRVVAKFIQEENKRLSRQIGINVEIYKVDLTQGTDFSLTFNEALKQLRQIGVTYSGVNGAPASITGGGSLSVAILDPNNDGKGVRGVFEALSSIGDTTRVAQFPMTTLNNRPVSRRVGQDQTYVASISNTIAGTIGTSQTSITPAVIPLGFSLQLTPRLLDDGRIMLQYSLSIIDLAGPIQTFGNASTGQVQLPVTDNRVFVQQSLLKSGSTLIIGGYDDEQATQNAQGIGSPFNFLLGGGSNTSTTHSMMFMAITPQVLDVPRTEQE
jgi:type IVB pilus formation R64 PilN family outer membrane protein